MGLGPQKGLIITELVFIAVIKKKKKKVPKWDYGDITQLGKFTKSNKFLT